MKFSKIHGCAIIIMLLFLTGCAAEQTAKQRYFWPPLPERPRIEWLGAYSGQADFPKTATQNMLDSFFGEDTSIALKRPIAIAADGKGKVYVTDIGIPAVVIFDLQENNISYLGGDDSSGLFQSPIGIALDADNNVYVSDPKLGSILVYDSKNRPLRSIKTAPHVRLNGAIAVDKKNKRLLVINNTDHSIAIFDLLGNFISSFGKRGNNDGEFSFPSGLVVNNRGEIIVADSMNARIQVFDANGAFIRKFGKRHDGPSGFQLIKGVAVDSDDNIYVTDGKSHKFEIFNSSGDYLLSIGSQHSSLTSSSDKSFVGGFLVPHGISIDSNDTIYVAEQFNIRFQVFQYLSDSQLKNMPIPGYTLP